MENYKFLNNNLEQLVKYGISFNKKYHHNTNQLNLKRGFTSLSIYMGLNNDTVYEFDFNSMSKSQFIDLYNHSKKIDKDNVISFDENSYVLLQPHKNAKILYFYVDKSISEKLIEKFKKYLTENKLSKFIDNEILKLIKSE